MPSSIKKQLKQSNYWKNDYSSKLLFNQELPNFETTDLFDEIKKLSNFDIINKQVIINFFASWCAPCKEEHPLLFSLKKNQPNIIIIGINYKDVKSNALKFLENEGNPYHFIGVDENGQPTINGKPALNFRIEKLMPDEKKSKKTQDEEKK